VTWRWDSGGTDCPVGGRFVEPMLIVVAQCRRPGRRCAGRPDIVVPDGSVEAIVPAVLPIARSGIRVT
jgi:hypothetical protein